MDMHFITEKVKSHLPQALDAKHTYAVLLPLVYVQGELHILLEVRSGKLHTQPGEISFPGGGIEPGETGPEAALRETCEELNISPDEIELLGELDYLASPFNFIIYAYAGILHAVDPAGLDFNRREVESVFTVPLTFFLENQPEQYEGQMHIELAETFPYELIPHGKDYQWRMGVYPVLFYRYGEYIIWGITARFIRNFVEILQER